MNLMNKKSAPVGTLINGQDHSTTDAQKSEAEILFEQIGTGAAYALRRPKGRKLDRELRCLISEANKNGDCIINTGFGYFRPGPDDEEDLKHYLCSELRRAEVIEDKVQSMREAYYGRY